MENLFDSLTANLSGGVRREKFDGRDYFVAPLSLINPGILNGSRGALLYTSEDAKKYATAWNGQPIVVYHPTRNGRPISANDSAVVHVGMVKNGKMGTKLQAEAWIDVENIKEHDDRVHDALVNGTPMEVSTGLGTDIEDVPAGTTFNGQLYVGIARNWRADHLALLPDQVGACSLRDGCGLMVNKNVDPESVENCDDSGECEACKAKRLAKVSNEEVENEETPEDVTNCKGEVECPKCKAKRLAREKAAEPTGNTEEHSPPEDLVDNVEQVAGVPTDVEYFDIAEILNCKGTGKPGPCALSERAAQLSKQTEDDYNRQLFARMREKRMAKKKPNKGPPEPPEQTEDDYNRQLFARMREKRMAKKRTTNQDHRNQFMFDISSILNCKGTGKPGPCPMGGGNKQSAKQRKVGAWAPMADRRKAAKKRLAKSASKSLARKGAEKANDRKLVAVRRGLQRKEDKVTGGGANLRALTGNQLFVTNLSHLGSSFEGGQLMADKKLTAEDRLKLVDHLVANSSVWEEEDRETLNTLEDVKLYGLAVQEQTLNADPEEAGDDSDDAGEAEPTGNKHKLPPALQKMADKKKAEASDDDEEEDEEEPVENRTRPLTEAEWLAQAPKSIRSVVQNAQRKEAEEKLALIVNMTEHLEDDQQSDVLYVLNTKSLRELQTLSVLSTRSPEAPTLVHNYQGQAVPMRVLNMKDKVDPSEVLALPTINWKQESKTNAG